MGGLLAATGASAPAPAGRGLAALADGHLVPQARQGGGPDAGDIVEVVHGGERAVLGAVLHDRRGLGGANSGEGDRPSEREGADQIDRSEADQNDRLSVNIEINTNCLSDTNPKIKKTPLSPSETSPPVAAKYAKHYEFYLVYRQELHNDQNYYVTMWDGYKTNFGRLVADGYTPAQYRTAIRQALKEWDKKFINPGSMVKHIAKLLADAGQSKQGSAASPRVRQYYDEVERRKNGGQFTDGAIISDDYPPVKTLRNAGPPPLE